MKSTPPHTHTHTHWPRPMLFLAAFQVRQQQRGTATSAFLVSGPLKLLIYFLRTSPPETILFLCPLSLKPVVGVFPSSAEVCATVQSRLCEGLCSVWGWRYHLVSGCSLSVRSRRCCLYLKQVSRSLWVPYYTLLVDLKARLG